MLYEETLTTRPSSLAPALPAREKSLLALAISAPLLTLMNYTTPMTTVAATASTLGADISGQTWILNGIALGLAAVLLVAGSLADTFGRRRALVVSSIALAVASVLVALAPNTLTFVLGRVLQGAASAGLLAASLGLIGHAYPPGAARAKATGLWGAMVSAGIAVGPLLAGALTAASWRLTYGVYVAGALALAAVSATRLPADPGRPVASSRRAVDVPGVITLGLGLAALLGGVTEGRLGWTRPIVLALLGMSALLLLAFITIEARRQIPMLDLGLFRRPMFLAATLGALVTGVGVIGLMSYLPTMVQHARGFSALASAGVFVLWSGVAVVSAQQARRFGLESRPQLALGLALSAVADLVLLGFASGWSWPRVVVALLIGGVGSGFANAALARIAIESVPAENAGMGSGANNTARYVGSALGVALTVSITTSGDLGRSANIALLVATGVTAIGAVGVVLLRDRR